MNEAPQVIDALDQHANLLRDRRALQADALARGSEPELEELMLLAERVQAALVPVSPDASFRAGLRSRLEEDAGHLRTAAQLLAPQERLQRVGQTIRRHPRRLLFGGGAAVAVLGLGAAAVLLHGRGAKAATVSG
jgi:hypothetical protein